MMDKAKIRNILDFLRFGTHLSIFGRELWCWELWHFHMIIMCAETWVAFWLSSLLGSCLYIATQCTLTY